MLKPSRHYCLTFFTEPEEKLIDSKVECKEIRYIIIGKEICPETKRTHWQSYVEFNKPKRMAGVKKLFDDEKVHIEIRRGTREQARDYCKKDNQYQEYGIWISGQGHRTDLHTIASELVNGSTSLKKIMVEEPELYCRYRNGLKDLAAVGNKEKSKEWRNVEVTLISGPTGCGKTRQAMEEATYKIQGTQLQWWQDYEEDEVICIDEYSNDVKITELLSLLDGYQLRLNVKGGHTYAMWKKVFITTNLKINEIHKEAKIAHREALFRRINNIIDLWNE